MPIRFSNYAGNKQDFTGTFNFITSNLNKKVYVEPFFGSGAVFFNLEKDFDLYVINDINPHVMNSIRSFRDGNYETYISLRSRVYEMFGDTKADKGAYVKFRDWFNTEYFGGKKDLLTEGFYFHFLMNSCINSLVRIGPNGFNQSYGNRTRVVGRTEFLEIQARLKKKVTILSTDYSAILDQYDSEETLIFLDPPYAQRNEVGYKSTYGIADLEQFLKKVKLLKGSVIYTDIACEQHNQLTGWIREDTKMLDNISPNRKAQDGNQEVFFRNFEGRKRGVVALF